MTGPRPGYVDDPEPCVPAQPDPARLSAPDLWSRIAAADLSVGGQPLEDYARTKGKLTADRDRILRAIEEYRRFAYLAIIKPGCVPPTPIDEIWRLHLSDTRGYDDLWQATVLRQRLDRDARATPGKGRAFDATVALYETEFGRKPPIAYWDTRSETWRWLTAGLIAIAFSLTAIVFGNPWFWLPAVLSLFLLREFRLVQLRSD